MTIVNSLLPFIGIIVFLIIMHELGHFVTAKLFDVKVLEFGLGYPPRLWGVRRGETEYTINALPLGGFVRLEGEEDPTEPRSLASRPRWQRLIVLAAGSGMNFILPIVLFTAGFAIPRDVSVGRAVVADVVEGSPAQEAGVEAGDIIYKIDGRDIKNIQDAGYNIRLHMGETMTWVVKRGAEFEELRVRARWAAPDIVYVVQPGDDAEVVAEKLGYDVSTVRHAGDIETTLEPGRQITVGSGPDAYIYTPKEGDTVASVARKLGVSEGAVSAAAGLPDQNRLQPGQELRFGQGPTGIVIAPQYPFTESLSYGPVKALRLGVQHTFDSLKLARNEIIGWIKGGRGPEVSGPIGIAQATGEIVEQAGWKSLMDFAALLSINLAVINILPLPMLDGGRIVFVLLEVMRGGRRVAARKEALVHLVGLAALLTLVVVISYFDIARIIRGDSIFR